METLRTIISFLFLFGLILAPIFLFVLIKKRYQLKFDFIIYFISGIILSGVIMLVFAWWSHYSNILLLKHYDGYVYNPDSGRYQIEYDNVLPKNIERVKSLEHSVMGIGWPLKAIMSLVFYSPYILSVYLVVYLVGQLIRKMKRNKKEHAPNTIYSK